MHTAVRGLHIAVNARTKAREGSPKDPSKQTKEYNASTMNTLADLRHKTWSSGRGNEKGIVSGNK